MSLQREKVVQAKDIVREEGVSVWLTIARESVMNSDPAIGLISEVDFGGMTAVLITPEKAICVGGHLDSYGYELTGVYDEVREYDKSFTTVFFEVLDEVKPDTIALNYSGDVAADGLTHGMYVQLMEWFEEYGFKGKVISAEKIIGKLRGRKTPEEISRMKRAIAATEQILIEAKDFIKAGMSQKTIHAWCQKRIQEMGHDSAWGADHNPGVMILNAPMGHAGPSDEYTVPKGSLVTLDFGVRVDDYCSDIQRVFYVPNDGETATPAHLEEGLLVIQDAVRHGMTKMMPGTPAYVPDESVRAFLAERNYPEFNFGFGHQVGRQTHDGGVMMGPRWERYLGRVEAEMEVDQVFTVDVNLHFEEGRIGQEDMAIVTKDGGVMISHRQEGIYFCKP